MPLDLDGRVRVPSHPAGRTHVPTPPHTLPTLPPHARFPLPPPTCTLAPGPTCCAAASSAELLEPRHPSSTYPRGCGHGPSLPRPGPRRAGAPGAGRHRPGPRAWRRDPAEDAAGGGGAAGAGRAVGGGQQGGGCWVGWAGGLGGREGVEVEAAPAGLVVAAWDETGNGASRGVGCQAAFHTCARWAKGGNEQRAAYGGGLAGSCWSDRSAGSNF